MGDTPAKKDTLEYIGPSRQEWFDGEKMTELVAGRRYQVDATLAAYMVEHDTRHWKRPDPPQRETAAVKE
jgi:hypothetical protein